MLTPQLFKGGYVLKMNARASCDQAGANQVELSWHPDGLPDEPT
jgi:hypothetical protein